MSQGQIALLTIISGDVAGTYNLLYHHLYAMSPGQNLITLLTVSSGDVAVTNNPVDISGDIASANKLVDYHLWRCRRYR